MQGNQVKWIEFEKEKPKLGRYCLVKSIYNNQVKIEVGFLSNVGTKNNPKFIMYSGCCHDIEDVKYWTYLDEFEETKLVI